MEKDKKCVSQCCGSGSGFKTFSRIRIRKNIPDSDLKYEFSDNMEKIDNFSTKMLNLNIYKFLYIKNVPKSLYLVIICNLTHLQDGNTKVKFMLRRLEKSCRIRKQPQSRIRIRIQIRKKSFWIDNNGVWSRNFGNNSK